MDRSSPRLGMVLLAFAALYLIWGSTYLAILYAIEGLPPFTMAGIRFSIAGALLYLLLRWRGEPAPDRTHWLGAAVVGVLLLGVGNGGVTWAEQRIPSGVAALLVAGTPAWMVFFEWLRPGGTRPNSGVVAGIVLGAAGIVLLVGPGEITGGQNVDLLGAAAVLSGSFAWAFGSILSRSLDFPKSAFMVTAMQMIVAGAVLSAFGAIVGEWRTIEIAAVSASSVLALGYLIVFGSWLGFGAYVWLLRVSTPARVATYAYVNPVVAVLLGWSIAGERLDGRMIAAMAVIVVGVALVTTFSTGRHSKPMPTCRPPSRFPVRVTAAIRANLEGDHATVSSGELPCRDSSGHSARRRELFGAWRTRRRRLRAGSDRRGGGP